MRRAPVLALALVAAALPVAAQAPCPDGHPARAELGIGLLHCVGGACALDLWSEKGRTHDFSTEPRVWYLQPNGPAAGVLSEGDVLVSVDGLLITSREGGWRLANLPTDAPVRLGIRRAGRDGEVRLTPVVACQSPELVVDARPDRPARPGTAAERRPGARLGIQLECGECGWRLTDEGWRFFAAEPLRVKGVTEGGPADRAGILPDDVLLRIEGRPFTAAGGGRFMNALRPGQSVAIELRRGGRVMTVRLALGGS